jgi:hypothetical protein
MLCSLPEAIIDFLSVRVKRCPAPFFMCLHEHASIHAKQRIHHAGFICIQHVHLPQKTKNRTLKVRFYKLEQNLASLFVVTAFHTIMVLVMACVAQLVTLMVQFGSIMRQFVTLFGNAGSISLTLFVTELALILVHVAPILIYSMLGGVDRLVILMDIAISSVGSRQSGNGKHSTNGNQSGFKHCGISCKLFV